MPKWRRLSGADVLRVPAGFGFQKLSQRGSHVKVRPYLQDGSRQSLTVPLPDELDIRPLLLDALATGKVLALPRFDAEQQVYLACRVLHLADDLRPGQFGISEPKESCPEVPLKQLDFVLAPGVAFALDGRRLGRGRGFYDRLLSSVRGVKCGIAFDEQIVDDIPAEPQDIRLDYVLTPTRGRRAGQSAACK